MSYEFLKIWICGNLSLFNREEACSGSQASFVRGVSQNEKVLWNYKYLFRTHKWCELKEYHLKYFVTLRIHRDNGPPRWARGTDSPYQWIFWFFSNFVRGRSRNENMLQRCRCEIHLDRLCELTEYANKRVFATFFCGYKFGSNLDPTSKIHRGIIHFRAAYLHVIISFSITVLCT